MHLLHLSAQAHSNPDDINQANYPNSEGRGSSAMGSPAAGGIAPIKPEDSQGTGQLPTPETVGEQPGQMQPFVNPPYVNNTGVVDMTRMPFTDFLRDVDRKSVV